MGLEGRRMRCLSCNNALNDYESVRKSFVTGEYMDLCNKCFKGLDIQTNEEDPDYSPALYEDPSYDELGVLVEYDQDHDYENL